MQLMIYYLLYTNSIVRDVREWRYDMNNYERRTLKKKEDIINSALTLFGKQGFSDVSIKDIASMAKVSQVSIYNYFGSKESLVEECAKVIMKDTIILAEEILASDEHFAQKLERALSLCSREINLSLNKFLSEKSSSDKQFLALITKNINSFKKEIYMKFIAYGRLEDVIDNNISDESIQLFIDSINSLGVTLPEEELQKIQTEIIQLFLYGLIGRPKMPQLSSK